MYNIYRTHSLSYVCSRALFFSQLWNWIWICVPIWIWILAKASSNPEFCATQYTYAQFEWKIQFYSECVLSVPANNLNLFDVLVLYCKSYGGCIQIFVNGLRFSVSLFLSDIHIMVYFANVCYNKFNVIDLNCCGIAAPLFFLHSASPAAMHSITNLSAWLFCDS